MPIITTLLSNYIILNLMKRLIRQVLSNMGYELISKNHGLTETNIATYMSNFDNLCQSYEYVFADLPKNDKRVKIMKALLGTPPSEAYYIIDSIHKTAHLNGDICEFGVAQGVTSSLIANEIADRKNTKLHLFDSFEGLPKPTEKDQLKDDIFNLGSMDAYTGTMNSPETLVAARLDSLNFPKERRVMHKGYFENLVGEKKNFPTKVSFAYVDFDFYEPIKIVLEYLDGVTDKGAMIVVDDYDFFSTGVKSAVDEFVDAQAGKYGLFVPNKVLGHFAVLTKN